MRKNGVNKNLTPIEGGLCAPLGFSASGIHCGIRKNKTKKDLALVVAEKKCATACVYTTNLVKGAPIIVTQKNVADGYAQAIIVNSGNANTCNANGIEIAEGMCQLVEKNCGIKASDVVVASTGVIGQQLSLDPIEKGMKELVAELGNAHENSLAAAHAIMTTDTVEKQVSYEFELGDFKCKIGAICKGSGMICPNMATMLMFVTTDVNISPEMLQKALSADVKDSLNMVSVDRDTSTNDTLCIMASGLAGNAIIDKPDTEYKKFCYALHQVTAEMCRKIAADGEGATKLIECKVSGAKSKQVARAVAKSVVCSDLLKAAIFGADANWGRVLCAIGYSGADVDVNKIGVAFESCVGKIQVCEDGMGIPFSEELAKKILSEKEIYILVDLNDGNYQSIGWGCDLTYEYVHINGDYRS